MLNGTCFCQDFPSLPPSPPPSCTPAGRAGKGGAMIGPPYLGPFFSNFFNTTRLVPLNPQAHSTEGCRWGLRVLE